MKKLNSKGFSPLEIILVVVVIGLLAGVGVYFFKHQKKDTPTTNTTSQTPKATQTAETKTAPDPTAGWVSYTSTTGKFSVKYPKTWVTAAHPEFCSDGILLLGPTTDSVGKCGADGARAFGQIGITWMPSSATTEPCGLSADYWKIDSKETVNVSGVSATKTSGTFLVDATDQGGQAKGNKMVQYCFVANGIQYSVSYDKWSDYPDALSDFNTMVLKTFKLTN